MSSIWTVRRSATDLKLTGLCGGVAQHWGVDPVLVRVGCALLALSGGVGVVLYVAGWLLIPVQGRDRAPVDDLFGTTGRRWPRQVWVALVVVACIAALGVFGSNGPFGVGPAVVLAIIWYFGFHRGGSAQTPSAHTPATQTPSAAAGTSDHTTVPATAALDLPGQAPQLRHPGPPTPFTEAAGAWRQRIEEVRRPPDLTGPVSAALPSPPPRTPEPVWPAMPPAPARSAVSDPEGAGRQAFLAHADPVGLYAEPAPTPTLVVPVRRHRRASARRLRLVSLIVLGLVLGTLGILDDQGLTVPLAGYLGAALLTVGLTLVAATWFGRPAGLIAVGVLLSVAVAVTSLGDRVPQLDHWDEASLAYTRVTELPAGGDVRDAGELDIDLSGLELTRDTAYRAHVGTGSLRVTVPADVNVVVRYTVDLGVVEVDGTETAGGTDLASTVSRPTVPEPGRPTLTLDLDVDQGSLEVRR